MNSSSSNFSFIENKGQFIDQNSNAVSDVKFLLNLGNGMNIQLKSNGFSYDTYSVEDTKNGKNYLFHRVDVELVGAKSNPQIIAEQPSEVYYNYYNSVTPQSGATFVRSYQKITYKDIYPGIDLEFTQNKLNGKSVEYNFIVNPGAKPSMIKLKYFGANQTDLVDNKVNIEVAHGNFTESIPASWLKETNEAINVQYVKIDNNTYSFDVPNYKTNQTLIIDPTPNLYFATYYGGTGSDVINSVVTNSEGYLYVTGNTTSIDNIVTTGAYQVAFGGSTDAFIAKFNSEGTQIWGTFLGGTDYDSGKGITCDNLDQIFVTGKTSSSSGIATAGAHQITYSGANDIFIEKFNYDGTRVWGTYYGGADNDDAHSIVNDASGNIYIADESKSLTYITTSGVHQSINGGDFDAFVTKFNTDGVQQWGTYLGGNSEDFGNSIALDASNNVYLCRYTFSENNIATSGAHQTEKTGIHDAFLVKFNNNGTRLWGTYYGGTNEDWGNAVKISSLGSVYIAGKTGSSSSISTTGIHQENIAGNYDVFLAKFNSSGVRQWGTYYGGLLYDNLSSLDIYGSTSIYIAGTTYSTTGISTVNAYQTEINGTSLEGFVTKFNQNGILQWGTYYGGSNDDNITAIECFGSSNIFAVGSTSSTSDIALPSTHQPTYGGGITDGFIAKFCIAPTITNSISGENTVCIGQITTYSVQPSAYATSYYWDLPMGVIGTSSTNSIEVEITEYAVSGNIQVYAYNSCSSAPASTLSLTVAGNPADAGTITGTSVVCFDETGVYYTVQAIANATEYNWTLPSGVTGSSTTSEIYVDFSSSAPTTSNISVYGSNACGAVGGSSSFSVTVNQVPADAGTISGQSAVCQGENDVTYTVPAISGANSYHWTLPTGASGTSSTNSISVDFGSTAVSGNVSVYASNNCGDGGSSSFAVTVNEIPATPVISLSGNILHSNAPSGNQWYNQDGILSGSTNQDFHVTQIGSYYTIVKLSGCSSNASNTIIISALGLTNEQNSHSVSLFPNPVSDVLNIKIEGNSESVDFEIITLNGKILESGNFSNIKTIETSNLNNGIYFLKIIDNKSIEYYKIIKQ